MSANEKGIRTRSAHSARSGWRDRECIEARLALGRWPDQVAGLEAGRPWPRSWPLAYSAYLIRPQAASSGTAPAHPIVYSGALCHAKTAVEVKEYCTSSAFIGCRIWYSFLYKPPVEAKV